MTTLPEHIAALREALEAGPTPGDWIVTDRLGYSNEYRILGGRGDVVCWTEPHAHSVTAANAMLIAAAHPEAIRAVLDALEAAQRDAERYRFIRDADRSDCITPELALYAMESLDEYVDAAMEDEMRNAALTNTGA